MTNDTEHLIGEVTTVTPSDLKSQASYHLLIP